MRPIEIYDAFMAYKSLGKSGSSLQSAIFDRLEKNLDKLSCRELLKLIEVCSQRELNQLDLVT